MQVLPGIGSPLSARRKPANIAATDSWSASNSDTTYTTTLNVGEAHANRIVVVGFSRFGTAGNYVAAKINGITQEIISPGSEWGASFVAALATTGTTISWSCQTETAGSGHGCCVWTLNMNKPTFNKSLTSGLSGVAEAHRGGAVFGLSRQAATVTFNWTGLIEDYDFNPRSSAAISGASLVSLGGNQPYSVASSSGSPSAIVLSLW